MQKPLVILGPTASGKTALALALARLTPCEIVSMDSMQIYRGMDIGTAKPSPEERQAVPHHLIDSHSIRDFSDAASYLEMVRQAEAEIAARGRLPLLVGGTAMYLKMLLEGIFEGPKADPALRAELRSVLEEKGPEYLHSRVLAPLDPAAAERLHPNDVLRVIRAIEVRRLTGRSITELAVQWDSGAGQSRYRLVGLAMPRDLLYRRIEERVDRMLEAGLVEEVRALKAQGLEENPRAAAAIGYKQILGYLNGEYGYERAVELLKRDTRRFAKHQLTWFNHFRDIEWHDVVREPDSDALAAALLAPYGV